MQKQITNIITQSIKTKVFPGCVIGIVRKNNQRAILPFGHFTYENNSSSIQENSIFDVASITKSVPTSSLMLKLIDEGRLKLEDKLIDFVPEFNNSDRSNATIRHLLTYTLDYDFRLSEYKNNTPDEIFNTIFTAEFKSKPGEKFFYTNATAILLGLVVERIFCKALDVLAEEYFFNPLGMHRTTFHPNIFSKSEFVPAEIDDWRGRIIQGEVHDESAFVLQQKTIVGSAGLFSTVPDLLNFMVMLLNKGAWNGNKYFSPEIIELTRTNQLGEIGESAGLGWELNQPSYMGKYSSPSMFGKTGFTGCVCVCDIEREIGVVMLSNYTFPKRKENAELINQVRRELMDSIFENL